MLKPHFYLKSFSMLFYLNGLKIFKEEGMVPLKIESRSLVDVTFLNGKVNKETHLMIRHCL